MHFSLKGHWGCKKLNNTWQDIDYIGCESSAKSSPCLIHPDRYKVWDIVLPALTNAPPPPGIAHTTHWRTRTRTHLPSQWIRAAFLKPFLPLSSSLQTYPHDPPRSLMMELRAVYLPEFVGGRKWKVESENEAFQVVVVVCLWTQDYRGLDQFLKHPRIKVSRLG